MDADTGTSDDYPEIYGSIPSHIPMLQAESLGTSTKSKAFPLISDFDSVLRELEDQRRAQSAAAGDTAGLRSREVGPEHEENSAGVGLGPLDMRGSWGSYPPQRLHLPAGNTQASASAAGDTSPLYLSTATANINMHIGQQFSPLKISSSNPIDNMMKDKNPTSRPTSDGQQPRTAPQLPMTKQVLYETLAREPVTQETINLGNTEVNLVHFTPGAIEHKLFDTPAPLASSMSYLRVGPAAHLGWSEVSFSLSQKAAGKRDPAVLRAISGAARPGDVIALLGPSGSGKTSLLNVLSGRITSMGGHKVHARITINGRIMSAQELGPKVAYVMQEDALHPTSTPREALAFSAALRLPPSVTPEQREVMVEAIISLLRLVCSFAGALCCVRSECPCLRKQASCFFGEGRFRQALTFLRATQEKCADTMIGGELIKGISGGEKKRTAIGVELITSPSILFLDEPTSGLDSYAAYTVVQALRDLAKLGCTVISTIHQPSSEVFHLFQRVMLLSEGQMIYDGLVDEMGAHFAALDYPVPAETNPADHVMFLMQTLPKPRLASLQNAGKNRAAPAHEDRDPHWVPQELAMSADALAWGLKRDQAGAVRQFLELGRRELRNTVRDKATLGARFGGAIVLNLLFSLIFFKVGDPTQKDYDMFSHFGGLANIAISGMFGSAMPLLQTFPSERPQFVREYANGTYGAMAYFWSKLVTEMPLSLSAAIITFCVSYWLQIMQGQFILHVLTMWLVGMAAASTALCVGCVAPSAKTAMEAAPGIFVPQILFAGFFIKIEQIPVWIRWAQYLCSLKFAINLHMIIEFTGACEKEPQTYDGAIGMSGGGSRKAGCAQLLEINDVKADLWYVYALILVGIFLFFRLLGLFFLTRRARGFALA